MNHVVLPSISTFFDDITVYARYVAQGIIIRKPVLLTTIDKHMNVYDSQLILYCYGSLIDNPSRFYEVTATMIEIVSARKNYWPELPIRCHERRKLAFEQFGVPSNELVSYVGTAACCIYDHFDSLTVSRAKACPKVYGFNIFNGNINRNGIIPSTHIDNIENCTMFLMTKHDHMIYNYTGTMSDATYNKLCNVFARIRAHAHEHIIDIATFLLELYGYFN